MNETMVLDKPLIFSFDTDFENTILMETDRIIYGIFFAGFIFIKYQRHFFMDQIVEEDIYFNLTFYNIFLIIFNACMCFEMGTVAWKHWNTRCHFKRFSDYTTAEKITHYFRCQLDFLFTEYFLDTMIFSISTEYNQDSLAHDFHHCIVIAVSWTNLNRIKLPFYVLLYSCVNSSVQTFTYLYCCLSSIGRGINKSLLWKKYVITIQIMHLLVALLYMAYSLLTGCEEFAVYELMLFGATIVVCVLLIDFYLKAHP